ncbi:MAG: hypothetical protein ACR2RF_28145 [Geminicoccaceae bacterium]
MTSKAPEGWITGKGEGAGPDLIFRRHRLSSTPPAVTLRNAKDSGRHPQSR